MYCEQSDLGRATTSAAPHVLGSPSFKVEGTRSTPHVSDVSKIRRGVGWAVLLGLMFWTIAGMLAYHFR